MCSELEFTAKYSVLCVDKLWIYPKALQRWPETTWVGFCPVWRSSWGLEELVYLFHTIPSQSWLGWALLQGGSCSLGESLGDVRLMEDLMQPWLLEVYFISKNTVSSEKWARWGICACSWTCEVEIRWEMVGRTWCSFWKRVVNWHKLHLLSAKPWGKKGFVFHFNTQINMWNTANPFLWWNFSSTAESLCKWDVGWDGIKVELGQASPPASRDVRWRRAELTCSCGIWFLSASEKPKSKKVLKYLRDLSADLLKQVWTYTEITPQMGLRWSFWLKFQPLSGP